VQAAAQDPFLWLAPELAGDHKAYHAYAERLTRDLRCYFASKGCREAEDLAAEVMSRVVKKLAAGGPSVFPTELARRQHIFGFAKLVLYEWRRCQLPARSSDEGGPLEIPVAPVDLVAEDCRRLLERAVREQMARLSEDDREILRQTELDPGYHPSLARLAKEQGRRHDAMRQRASRARRRLRDLLERCEQWEDLNRCYGVGRVPV
jgi:DNA-directed RNA polymerase specialized sigma24 family protein